MSRICIQLVDGDHDGVTWGCRPNTAAPSSLPEGGVDDRSYRMWSHNHTLGSGKDDGDVVVRDNNNFPAGRSLAPPTKRRGGVAIASVSSPAEGRRRNSYRVLVREALRLIKIR